jgi:hypothetical protein
MRGVRGWPSSNALHEVASEIMGLTKMNWNQTQLDGLLPITLRTARRVGEVLRHVAASTPIATRYAYYM